MREERIGWPGGAKMAPPGLLSQAAGDPDLRLLVLRAAGLGFIEGTSAFIEKRKPEFRR